MPTILGMKDRIKLKVGKVTFTLKPLSVLEQQRVSSHKVMNEGIEIEDTVMTSYSYIKFALKDLKGVKTHAKKDYELEFDGDYLSDDCASEIFSMSLGAEFIHAVQNLRYGNLEMNYFGSTKKLKGVKLEVMPFEGKES